MAKAKKIKVEVPEVAGEGKPVVVSEKNIEEVVELVKTTTAPVATGKFYVEQREGGAVVIGKLGQVVSNPMPINKANRLADHMNNAR